MPDEEYLGPICEVGIDKKPPVFSLHFFSLENGSIFASAKKIYMV